MLTKRLIACFDIRDKMVTKAHKFQNNIDIDRADVIAERFTPTKLTKLSFLIYWRARKNERSISIR